MSGVPQLYGCTHKTHVPGQQRCWSMADIDVLEAQYGRISDAALSRRLGRSPMAILLKTKKLGIHKRDVGMSSREVARIFAVDETTVSKVWIRRGLLRARRSVFLQGPNRMWIVQEREVERFIREHGQWFDAIRMPESPYRDLALSCGRWFSLPDVMYLTGRHPHILSKECLAGRWPARKRGTHWMVHESTIPAIGATAGYAGRYASIEKREALLEHRRAVRKGLESRRPLHARLLRYRVVTCPAHLDADCDTCQGKGRVLSALLRGVGIQPLPEAWAA